MLSEPRPGKNTQHTMPARLRQRVYGRLAGYEGANDAERLRFQWFGVPPPLVQRV